MPAFRCIQKWIYTLSCRHELEVWARTADDALLTVSAYLRAPADPSRLTPVRKSPPDLDWRIN